MYEFIESLSLFDRFLFGFVTLMCIVGFSFPHFLNTCTRNGIAVRIGRFRLTDGWRRMNIAAKLVEERHDAIDYTWQAEALGTLCTRSEWVYKEDFIRSIAKYNSDRTNRDAVHQWVDYLIKKGHLKTKDADNHQKIIPSLAIYRLVSLHA